MGANKSKNKPVPFEQKTIADIVSPKSVCIAAVLGMVVAGGGQMIANVAQNTHQPPRKLKGTHVLDEMDHDVASAFRKLKDKYYVMVREDKREFYKTVVMTAVKLCDAVMAIEAQLKMGKFSTDKSEILDVESFVSQVKVCTDKLKECFDAPILDDIYRISDLIMNELNNHAESIRYLVENANKDQV
jgi:hypothetical protein